MFVTAVLCSNVHFNSEILEIVYKNNITSPLHDSKWKLLRNRKKKVNLWQHQVCNNIGKKIIYIFRNYGLHD